MDKYCTKFLRSLFMMVGYFYISVVFFSSVVFSQENKLIFTDVALESGFQDVFGHARALVSADFDGNGWNDFYIGNPGDDSFILFNDGPDSTGVHQLRKGQILLKGVAAFTASAADYDNDGDPDLFVGVGGKEGVGFDYLFRNDAGLLTDVSVIAGIQGPLDSEGYPIKVATNSGVWEDYDKDGDLDLFVSVEIVPAQSIFPDANVPISLILPDNLGWRDSLFRNNGDGTFTDITKHSGIHSINSSTNAAWGDFNNDGWPDLIIPYFFFYSDYGNVDPVYPNGEGYLVYQNNQDGTFSEIDLDEQALEVGRSAYWATVVEDFNNDGWLDIVGFGIDRPSAFGDSHSLLMNHGQWLFTNEAVSSGLVTPGARSPRVMGCQAGDIDGDGFPDIISGNGWPFEGEADSLYINNNDTEKGVTFNDVSSVIDFPAKEDPNCSDVPAVCVPKYPYHGHGIVLLDYDKDGDIDLAMVKGGSVLTVPNNITNAPNRLFRNDSVNVNNWLFIELVGLVSNRDGIGARIEVEAVQQGGNTQKIFKHVKAGSGFSASGPREIFIGLGHSKKIPRLTVSWPSGTKTTLRNVNINQRISVQEPLFYHDDFNENNDDSDSDWNSLTGEWSIDDGYYSQTGDDFALAVNTETKKRNFSVASKLTYLNGDQHMGLLGRTSANGRTFYGAILRGKHAYLYKSVRGKVQRLGAPIPIDTMTQGKSYIVGLAFQNNTIEMSVDGQSLTIEDKSIRRGGIGLMAKDTASAVDYVVVY